MAEQNISYPSSDSEILAEQYKIVGILGQKGFDKPSPNISSEALRVLGRSPQLQKDLGELVRG